MTVVACLNEMTRGSPDARGLKMQFLSDSSGNWVPQSSLPALPLDAKSSGVSDLSLPSTGVVAFYSRTKSIYSQSAIPLYGKNIVEKEKIEMPRWSTNDPFCVSSSLYFRSR